MKKFELSLFNNYTTEISFYFIECYAIGFFFFAIKPAK